MRRIAVMDASRHCLKFHRRTALTLQIGCYRPFRWGLTAHGLFILRCSNYLVMLELTNLA
jgi:hypothetical protein